MDRTCKARDQNVDLREASINWKSSELALKELFTGLPYRCPEPPESETAVGADDDIPF
ncbi:MAG: hypothetical protein ACRDL3_12265 [Solirubrobacterales bacterium]